MLGSARDIVVFQMVWALLSWGLPSCKVDRPVPTQ